MKILCQKNTDYYVTKDEGDKTVCNHTGGSQSWTIHNKTCKQFGGKMLFVDI